MKAVLSVSACLCLSACGIIPGLGEDEKEPYYHVTTDYKAMLSSPETFKLHKQSHLERFTGDWHKCADLHLTRLAKKERSVWDFCTETHDNADFRVTREAFGPGAPGVQSMPSPHL